MMVVWQHTTRALALLVGFILAALLAHPVQAQSLGWATGAGGTSSDQGRDIAVDGSGNSYVTGSFEGSATFGAGEAAVTLTGSGGADIFVAKYGADGSLLWAMGAGGTSYDVSYGIAVDGSGNSYVTGYFDGSATFGAGEAAVILTGSGSYDIFVAKYGADGSLLWATGAGGTSVDFGFGIAVDGSGNSYVTGFFYDSATFGAGEAAQATGIHAAAQTAETTLTSAGGADIFLATFADAATVPVTLSYFLATAGGDGTHIEWSTATETGNAGFNLYVETAAGRKVINPELIPSAVIDSVEPQDYVYDAAGVQGEFFFIEQADIGGGSELFGPYAVDVPVGSRVAPDPIGQEHRIYLPSVVNR